MSTVTSTSVHRHDTVTSVTFVVPPGLARHAELVGEFASWTPLAMDLGPDGAHRARVNLPSHRQFAYQFMIDGDTIINDPAALHFEVCTHGGHSSVVQT